MDTKKFLVSKKLIKLGLLVLFIGNIPECVYSQEVEGDVKFLSKDWWEYKDKKWTIPDDEIMDLAEEKPFEIQFVGNGNIQQSIEKNADIPANTGVGIILDKYLVKGTELKDWWGFYKVEFEAVVNVASTVGNILAKTDTIGDVVNQSDFGRSILTPLNSGQAVSVLIKGYRQKAYFGLISGYHIRFLGSNRDWVYTDTLNASTSALRVGVFHEFVPTNYRNKFSAELSISYAFNFLSSDIALKKNKDTRMKILNTDKTSFHGIDIALAFELKNIRAEFSIPILFMDKEVSGLSGARLITNIGFIGGFAIDLN